MDIFAEPTQASGASNGIPMLEEMGAVPAATPVAPAASPIVQALPAAAAPVSADPHQARVNQAVQYMAATYWSKAKMHGDLLVQWNGYYQALLNGATDAASVSRAVQLADFAFVIALSRQNMTAG